MKKNGISSNTVHILEYIKFRVPDNVTVIKITSPRFKNSNVDYPEQTYYAKVTPSKTYYFEREEDIDDNFGNPIHTYYVSFYDNENNKRVCDIYDFNHTYEFFVSWSDEINHAATQFNFTEYI